MKLKLIYIVFLGLFLNSCNESDFLKEIPKDNIYSENIYTSKTGFKFSRNALFALIRSERTEKSTDGEFAGFLWKIGVDNGIANAQFDWIRQMGGYSQFNSQARVINTGFNYYFSVVNAANMCISRANNPDVNWEGSTPLENERNKNEAIAYARFARAWAYRFLVFGWGDIPISTSEIDGTNYRNDWERAPMADVKRFIIRDFQAALPYLADNSQSIETVSKAVAQHYLAEMYTSVYYDSNKTNKTALDSAFAYADSVVTNPKYKLITARYGVNASKVGVPFMDMFTEGNVQPIQGNTEVLWWFSNKNLRLYNGTYNNVMRRGWVSEYFIGWTDLYCCPEYGGRGVSRMSINPKVFDSYEAKDNRFSEYAVRKYYLRFKGGPFGTSKSGAFIDTVKTLISMNDRDIRRWDWISKNDKLASTRKWDWCYPEESLWFQSEQLNDQPYIRLAETYLLMAEIEMERGNLTNAKNWINLIRVRSNATPITEANVTLDYILDERSRELITEEHRRLTLVRVGKLYERTVRDNKQAKEGYAPGMQTYHQLLPLPQSVIDGNTGKKMLNNPGYN